MIEPLCCRFKDIAEFVVQSVDPPRYVDDSATPAMEPSRACDYCGTEHAERAYKEHLVTAHADLLFHCDECDTYVDRKDFLLHMSLHAVQYTNGHEKKTEPAKKTKRSKRKKIEEKDENGNNENENNERNAQKCLETTTQRSDATAERVKTDAEMQTDKRELPSAGVNVDVSHQNEFSDHSDAEYGFDPLPESVFEAIEDSQDSQPVDETEAHSSRPSEINDDGAPNERDEGPSEVAPPPPPPQSDGETLKKQKKTRTCPICSKVYTASSSYFYHMKYFHRRSKEHECDVCGKKFGTKGGLAQHATVHTGECRLECKQCGKKFRSKASLYIHEQTHSGVKGWSCAQCHSSFRWRTHLARHMQRHGAERSHACAACGRAFSVRCDLLRHARTHRAGDFACAKCGLKFAQLRYLKVHVARKHAPAPAPAAPAAPAADKPGDAPTNQCA